MKHFQEGKVLSPRDPRIYRRTINLHVAVKLLSQAGLFFQFKLKLNVFLALILDFVVSLQAKIFVHDFFTKTFGCPLLN